jgi:hypothetical protein
MIQGIPQSSSLQAIEYIPIKKYFQEALKTDLNRRDAAIIIAGQRRVPKGQIGFQSGWSIE